MSIKRWIGLIAGLAVIVCSSSAHAEWGMSTPGTWRVVPSSGCVGDQCQDGECNQSVHPAVCGIYVNGSSSPGSGTLIWKDGDDGMVLTAGHLFRRSEPRSILVVFSGPDPGGTKHYGRLLAVDKRADVAIVRIQAPPGVEPMQVGPTPKQGDRVWFAGWGGRTYRRVDGRVLGYGECRSDNLNIRIADALTVSGVARNGDSGGPIVDSDGHLVGMVTATTTYRGGDTVGPHATLINSTAYRWTCQKLLPWNAAVDASRIQADSQEKQALIGLAAQNRSVPVGSSSGIDMQARADVAALKAQTAQHQAALTAAMTALDQLGFNIADKGQVDALRARLDEIGVTDAEIAEAAGAAAKAAVVDVQGGIEANEKAITEAKAGQGANRQQGGIIVLIIGAVLFFAARWAKGTPNQFDDRIVALATDLYKKQTGREPGLPDLKDLAGPLAEAVGSAVKGVIPGPIDDILIDRVIAKMKASE